MDDDDMIEEITRIILTNYFNSSAPHIQKKLVPLQRPPWLTNHNKPLDTIREASIYNDTSWASSEILTLLLHSFFATLCYSIIAMRVFVIIRKRREKN